MAGPLKRPCYLQPLSQGERAVTLIVYLTRIHFADRVLEDALSEELDLHGIVKPLIVIDAESEGGDGIDRLFCVLSPMMAQCVYVAGKVENYGAEISTACSVMSEQGCDGIIGFGGVPAIDLARMLGDRRKKPVIAVPTCTDTIGLGPVTQHPSQPIGSRTVLPVAILCDATLAINSGPVSTAAAGMDALIHCLESFLSTAFNPPADGIALDGLRRAALHLEAAVHDGHNIAVRREMLAAALDAGLASEKGYGGIEAASHGLEAMVRTRHGLLHGALLGEVLTFNAPAVADRLEQIRKTLELPTRADPAERLSLLAERVGLPLRLGEIGMHVDLLPEAALHAAADPANSTNPRHATAVDYERMMRAIF